MPLVRIRFLRTHEPHMVPAFPRVQALWLDDYTATRRVLRVPLVRRVGDLPLRSARPRAASSEALDGRTPTTVTSDPGEQKLPVRELTDRYIAVDDSHRDGNAPVAFREIVAISTSWYV